MLPLWAKEAMTQIQVGPKVQNRGGNIQAKKELKEAVAADASTIFPVPNRAGGQQV